MSSPFMQNYRPPFAQQNAPFMQSYKPPGDVHTGVGLEQPFTLNRTAPTQNAAAGASVSNYGNAGDWANVLGGLSKGVQAASPPSMSSFSKKDALEAKRRTIANLLNQALRRNQGMSQAHQGYANDVSDYQAQALQQLARGFTAAMQGSTQY